MIHGAGHYSDEYKVLGEFGTKYATDHPTKDRGRNPTPRKNFHKNQENNAIINNVVDEIQMTESKEVNTVNHEAQEFLESDYNDNELYKV